MFRDNVIVTTLTTKYKKLKAKGLGSITQTQKDSHVDNYYKLQLHNSNKKIHLTDAVYEHFQWLQSQNT